MDSFLNNLSESFVLEPEERAVFSGVTKVDSILALYREQESADELDRLVDEYIFELEKEYSGIQELLLDISDEDDTLRELLLSWTTSIEEVADLLELTRAESSPYRQAHFEAVVYAAYALLKIRSQAYRLSEQEVVCVACGVDYNASQNIACPDCGKVTEWEEEERESVSLPPVYADLQKLLTPLLSGEVNISQWDITAGPLVENLNDFARSLQSYGVSMEEGNIFSSGAQDVLYVIDEFATLRSALMHNDESQASESWNKILDRLNMLQRTVGVALEHDEEEEG